MASSEPFDLRIDGGLVAGPDGAPRVASVGIRDGRIAAVGDLGDHDAGEAVDADGLAVLPGVIDTHVHLGFTDEAREWHTESRAALIGGVTTMCVYYRNAGEYDELLPGFIAAGERDSHADFVVHLGILHDGHLERLGDYVARYGLTSIKMYTTYKRGELSSFGAMGQDDGFILDVMRAVAQLGGVRIHVHCENDDIAERGGRRWRDEGTPGAQWSRTRPPVAEVEAIRRIALFGRTAGAPVFIPHVSSEDALATVLAERAAGTDIRCETCPQYLASARLDRPDHLAKVNPPVRVEESGERLWAALRAGQIDVVGTDHACWTRADKTAPNVLEARPGFPGMGTLLPVLLDGVNRGWLALADVAAAQLRAARNFGLADRGAIAPGYAADLVLADLAREREVDSADLQGLSDFTPYEGLTLRGWPVLTVKGGKVAVRDGRLLEDAQRGAYLRDHEGSTTER
jgi:dihydroorotase (multifunctional complex type)